VVVGGGTDRARLARLIDHTVTTARTEAPQMNVTRTPDSAFAGLEDYPFTPRYAEVGDGLRMHFLDEGEPTASPVLMLHGEPTWSYLYRHMIPVCVAAGHRVVAPDLIGFGKSDKPADEDAYTYQRHVDWVTELITALDLRDITLFCQDWGALIGLRVAAEQDDRFARIVVGNGALPIATPETRPPIAAGLAFLGWRTFATFSPRLPVSRIVDTGSLRKLSPGERRAYDAPYAGAASKAGARAFPKLVPLTAKNPAIAANRRAWEALGRWEKPFLTVFSDRDPILGRGDRVLREHVPGAKGMAHTRTHGGHFLQEDAGPDLARQINELIATT
jgi:haloalkane dehalogenase